ncbi:MAG: hypothetical protein H6670_02980 [Anaerolineaceae bacterium]|nr:hypothetical protein [Anaerolineaceae bacterium]
MTDTDRSFITAAKVIDGLLLVLSLGLSLLAFIAIQEILLTIAAPFAVQSAENSVQSKYIVVTVRNFWVFIGGALMLAYWVGSIDYHLRRLGSAKTRRILTIALTVEIILIAIGAVI